MSDGSARHSPREGNQAVLYAQFHCVLDFSRDWLIAVVTCHAVMLILVVAGNANPVIGSHPPLERYKYVSVKAGHGSKEFLARQTAEA